MDTKIIKVAKFRAPIVSRAIAMAQIAKAIELQKRGIVKF